ncbi:FecCD family ABC transporter permease [Paenibacillus flagellatus]|uniref:Iron ABC transporter n=1 Tax=Paenibacillus flagellatus TaxID=2211139 RepID=A0A2V5K6R3_9BACL|nr:iron ABC transporter permease [Paenibacillus flagellatus]PYI55081.1 iron ABC transporter [Paenibacillus flagellatus]
MHPVLRSATGKLFGLATALLLLAAAVYASIVYGVIGTTWRTAIDAYFHFNGSNEHIAIKELRVPRALIAAAVGASLGIAGTLLQALTKNPLADLGLMGINSGAGLAVVAGVTFFSVQSLSEMTWIAFLGAVASGVVVYMLGSVGREGLSPLKVTLAGAAVTALASSMIHALLLIDERKMDEVLLWLAGSVQGRKLSILIDVLPYMAASWIVALIVSGPINTLLLGEDVAKGLGQRTLLVKAAAGLVIMTLCAASVAAAGPIAFVGLVTPHLCRYLVGGDIRWMTPYSAFVGAILLIAADIAARFVAMPGEIPIGVMTALIGTPFFIFAARKGWSKS